MALPNWKHVAQSPACFLAGCGPRESRTGKNMRRSILAYASGRYVLRGTIAMPRKLEEDLQLCTHVVDTMVVFPFNSQESRDAINDLIRLLIGHSLDKCLRTWNHLQHDHDAKNWDLESRMHAHAISLSNSASFYDRDAVRIAPAAAVRHPPR